MTKGMILAAGQGTRVRPLTKDLPKPMVPILGKPLMEYLIEHLARHGIRAEGEELPAHGAIGQTIIELAMARQADLIVAGAYGAWSVSRRILMIQALPAAVALLALWVAGGGRRPIVDPRHRTERR